MSMGFTSGCIIFIVLGRKNNANRNVPQGGVPLYYTFMFHSNTILSLFYLSAMDFSHELVYKEPV